MYSGAPEQQRPVAVTVFAVLNIIFAVLGLVCGPLLLVQMFLPHSGPTGGLYAAMRQGLYGAWTLVTSVLGLVFAGVLLASGIATPQRAALQLRFRDL